MCLENLPIQGQGRAEAPVGFRGRAETAHSSVGCAQRAQCHYLLSGPRAFPGQPLSRRHAFGFVFFFNFHVSSQADPMVLRVLGCQDTRVSLWPEYTMMPSQKHPTLSPTQFSSHDLPPWQPPYSPLTSDENIWPQRDLILTHSQPTTRRANTTTDFEMIMPPQVPTPMEIFFP